MNRLIIIGLLSFTHTQICLAQSATKNRYDVLRQQLKERLTILDHYNFWNDPDMDFDADKYSDTTAVLLTQLLVLKRSTSMNLKEFENLEVSAKTNDSLQIRIYNFGYNCGGTRGWITHPVIQWRDQYGTPHAYNLSKKINCNFNIIYKLKANLGNFYLLIGAEKGNSSTIQYIAYVIKIVNDKIFANHKSFINRPYINLPNAEISFDPGTQILRCFNDTERDDFLNSLKYIEPTNDTTATNRLLKMFSREYDEPICLKFNANRFIRLTNCR